MLTLASVVLGVALQTAAPALADAYFFFIQGRILEGRGDLIGAISAYRRASELEPKASAIHAELAGLYARAGRAADAISEGEAAIALDKSDREANRILGLVQAAVADNMPAGAQQARMMTDAIGHLEQALVGARDPGAELTLGRLDVRLNRLDKGVETLRNFLFDNPGYPEAVMLLAEALERRGEIAEAIEVLAPLATGPGAQADAQVALAGLYERVDRWKDAAAMWGSLSIAGTDPSYRMQQATALMNAGDVTAGRDVLTAFTKDHPRDLAAWYLLAQAERRLGHAAAAEAASKRISEVDANDPRGPLAMAEAKEAARDFAGVVAALQPLYDSRRAQARADDDVLAFAGATLASAYQELKQYDRAEKLLREMIARNPADAVALNSLGFMLAEHGRKLDEALALVKRALTVDADNPSYLDSLGWVYLKQGNATGAVEPLERAVKAAPQSSVVLDHLGDVYFSLKRYRDAADTFARSLAADRDGIDVSVVTRKRDRARELAK